MPGVSARSSTKNMSRSKRASADKNARRVDAALRNELEFCIVGKISKALGNKMFMAYRPDRTEHLCHIRGKMERISIGDVVLLNVRDYESRHLSSGAVYDIMAVFAGKDISRLIRTDQIPSWMGSKGDTEDSDELRDLFDYDVEEEEDEEEKKPHHSKKDKKNHRLAPKNGTVAVVATKENDGELNIDAI
jgi:translation initiation factor IF-1